MRTCALLLALGFMLGLVCGIASMALVGHVEAASPRCRGGGVHSCTPTPTSTRTVTATATATPTPTLTTTPTATPTVTPVPSAAPPDRWPVPAPVPHVRVYYASLSDSRVRLAVERGIAAINAPQALIQLDAMGTVTNPEPCSSNYFTEEICDGGDTSYIAVTGTGGYYPWTDATQTVQDFSTYYIRAASTYFGTGLLPWAQSISALRATSLSPNGTCCGWTVQDVLDMAACHELLHVLGLPDVIGEIANWPYHSGCIPGDRNTPSSEEIAYITSLYAGKLDGWGWPEGAPYGPPAYP